MQPCKTNTSIPLPQTLQIVKEKQKQKLHEKIENMILQNKVNITVNRTRK
jgi:hypothetical protein